MSSTCDTKTLLMLAAGLLIIYLLLNNNGSLNYGDSRKTATTTTTKEEFDVEMSQSSDAEAESEAEEVSVMSETTIATQPNCMQVPIAGPLPISMSAPSQTMPISQSDQAILKKFKSRNQAAAGTYKNSSYNEGNRDQNESTSWNDYFNSNNNVVGGALSGSNGYMPVDESGNKYAMFRSSGQSTCGSNQNCDPEDLFDVDKYLPQEVTDDWFEVQPEPISIKNRHLINVTKPIGVNTIGTSLKNSSHDIRGAPSCPKSVISPFLNSSIEPDLNYKPLY